MTTSISSISEALFRYSCMFRNRLAWMLGCQVMNQSVEKGSWPFEGDLPETSLYRRSRRSYDMSVSDSSTCRRAPRWISVMARSICLASVNRLLVRMVCLLGGIGNRGLEVAGLDQAASWWRPAIRMEACSRVTESLADLEWLVS